MKFSNLDDPHSLISKGLLLKSTLTLPDMAKSAHEYYKPMCSVANLPESTHIAFDITRHTAI